MLFTHYVRLYLDAFQICVDIAHPPRSQVMSDTLHRQASVLWGYLADVASAPETPEDIRYRIVGITSVMHRRFRIGEQHTGRI